ncbi:hypothetical protein K151_1279 [Proteus hauseri ZMd44]|nr:hypothetical protein K151_1279 [Proteus hauseri ZMd44]
MVFNTKPPPNATIESDANSAIAAKRTVLIEIETINPPIYQLTD